MNDSEVIENWYADEVARTASRTTLTGLSDEHWKEFLGIMRFAASGGSSSFTVRLRIWKWLIKTDMHVQIGLVIAIVAVCISVWLFRTGNITTASTMLFCAFFSLFFVHQIVGKPDSPINLVRGETEAADAWVRRFRSAFTRSE
jgi:hypothetical protein